MIHPLHFALILLAIGCALGAVAWIDLIRKRREQGAFAMARLASAMKLSWSERRFVCRLARAADVPPAAALLSRGCFDYAVNTASVSNADQQRAAALRERLFI